MCCAGWLSCGLNWPFGSRNNGSRVATAQEMITRSMRLIGALGQGDAMTASEATDGLTALNVMLDSWAVEKIPVYSARRDTFVPNGSESYTIGTGGTINIPRPNEILSMTWRSNNVDYFIHKTGQHIWDQISFKSVVSIPEIFYYEKTFPLGRIYIFPSPSGGMMEIQSNERLQSFSGLTDQLSLPPGYQRAIEFNLALELAGEYAMPVPDTVANRAIESKAAISSANIEPLFVLLDPITHKASYNIYGDN